MTLFLRMGKMGMGVEPALMHCQVLQRVGTALLAGEVLMLDMSNSSFDNDADDGGMFGNAITPAATGTGGVTGAVCWPYVATTSGSGTASGTRVDAVIGGITKVRCRNTAGSGTVKGQIMRMPLSSLTRQPEIDEPFLAADNVGKKLGFTLEATPVTATPASINCLFWGLDMSGFTA